MKPQATSGSRYARPVRSPCERTLARTYAGRVLLAAVNPPSRRSVWRRTMRQRLWASDERIARFAIVRLRLRDPREDGSRSKPRERTPPRNSPQSRGRSGVDSVACDGREHFEREHTPETIDDRSGGVRLILVQVGDRLREPSH
jgi:hypothetical protein